MSGSVTNATNIDNCVALGWNTTIPWDNPHNLVSLETKNLLQTVHAIILLPILYIFGAPANIISMIVFFKQGLNERINLCLFLLAIADFIYLTFVVMYRASRLPNPFTNSMQYGVVYLYMLDNNLTGLYGFVYVSMLISAVVSTERCICVLFPLQAQRCIPTKAFAFTLITSTCVVGFLRFVVTAKYGVACFYEERSGRSLWQVTITDYYLQNKELIDILDGTFYGFFISLGCPLVVLLTSIITAVKLHEVIRWRGHSSSTISSKEIGVTKMLICLSIEFLIFITPHAMLRTLPMFGSEVKPGGVHFNTFALLVQLSELCAFMSSCVNIFVYYFVGSRYRETLHKLLSGKSSSKSHNMCKN